MATATATAAALLCTLLLVTVTQAVPLGQFICTDEGYWPDPEDCTQYHVCIHIPNANPEYIDSYVGQCEDDHAYDPASTTCRFTTNDEVCQHDYECHFPGETGVVDEDPNMYWECDSQYQFTFRHCDSGYVYNGAACVLAATTVEPVTTPTPPLGGVCVVPGVWPDPYSCRYYYTCSTKLKLKHAKCHSSYHFDEVELKCLKGKC